MIRHVVFVIATANIGSGCGCGRRCWASARFAPAIFLAIRRSGRVFLLLFFQIALPSLLVLLRIVALVPLQARKVHEAVAADLAEHSVSRAGFCRGAAQCNQW